MESSTPSCHQDGLHTAHVLLASAAALVIALGEDDGVLPWPQLRLSGSRTNWTAGPKRCALGLAVHQEWRYWGQF